MVCKKIVVPCSSRKIAGQISEYVKDNFPSLKSVLYDGLNDSVIM